MREEAGLRKRIYVPVREYPDEVVLELVGAAAELTDTDPDELLYGFGRPLVPPLTSVYGVHVDGEWTGLELIANVETYIHEALWGDRVVVVYASDRGRRALAEGLPVGVGEQYDEPLSVEHRQCVHEGSQRCGFPVARETQTESRTAGSSAIGRGDDDRTTAGSADERPSSSAADPTERPTRPGTD